MSESRKQFRERIGRTNYEAMLQRADVPENEVQWDDETDFFRDGMGHAAEAVYAQALRDVMDWLDEQASGPSPTVFIATGFEFIETIDPWLTERGISLEADDANPQR